MLAKFPILAIYDPKDEVEVHCDASAAGFGSILLQKKDDKKWHPIFFFSKRTTPIEAKYHSFELETLAIVYALKRFRIYLYGRPFKIVTDCNALTQTLSKKELNPRIARWALELQNFDYSLEHRENGRMQHVDALSRVGEIMILETNTLEENLIICQNKDSNLKGIKKILEEKEHKFFELRNGVVFKKFNKDTILFCVPKSMEKQVIFKHHDELGHVGINKTIQAIKQSYWFPEMKTKVEDHIKNCLRCIAFSEKNGKEEGYIHNIPKSNAPFDIVHIDHFGPVENNNRSKKHILVIIDGGTKFVRLYATKSTNTKEAIKALKDYFRSYSRPKIIISDRGSCFTSNEFSEFLASQNVKHIKIATGSPQANGQVERINRSIKPMLAKLTEPNNKLFWDNLIEDVEFAINNTINRTIDQLPSFMLFGNKQRGKIIDCLKENYLEALQDKTDINLATIRHNAETRQKRVQQYNKTYADSMRKEAQIFKKGDYVMLRNFDTSSSGPKKLIPKFKGPYEVDKVLGNDRYLVKDVENIQQTRIPYKGIWAISNIRPWIKDSC